MVSAVTTASSVCGCWTTRRTTTMPRTNAPAMMARPMDLPNPGRRSLILAPEHEEPRGERPQTGEAWIHHGRGTDIRCDLHGHEHLQGDDRQHDPGDDREQPGREERAEDVHGRRHAAAGQ